MSGSSASATPLRTLCVLPLAWQMAFVWRARAIVGCHTTRRGASWLSALRRIGSIVHPTHSAQGPHRERAHAGRDFIREVTMMTGENMPRHPAKYTDVLLPVFARILREHGAQSVLDPMAGVGKIGLLRDYGFS